MPHLLRGIHPIGDGRFGYGDRSLMAVVDEHRLRRILEKLLDEREFLSPYGIRSLSRFHDRNPYVFQAGDADYQVNYLPAESDSGMFGGNSNWRGPIWMPMNVLLIRALMQFYLFYGDTFTVECPTGSAAGCICSTWRRTSPRGWSVSSRAMSRDTARSTAARRCSRPIHAGATTCCFTSTFTATTGRVSVRATRRDGPGSSLP